MLMKRFAAILLVLVLPVVLIGAQDPEKKGKQGKGKAGGGMARPQKAVAVLHALGNSMVKGTVTFSQKEGYIAITGEITGLTPGEHAFHVHEFGDCSSADGMSTGGHFNPTGMPHGGPDNEKRHVGDFGNIKADESGKVVLDIKDKVIRLAGGSSIIGRALIVHGGVDDLTSQPAGNAGPRIACAVIGIAKQ
jgi:Cu-Zn family superoxide dismutase